MKKWSKSWRSSKKKSKQIKYIKNAPLHLKKKLMKSPLSKELRKKYNTRNMTIRKDDKVKVMRGQFKKRNGQVSRVDTGRFRVYVEGIELIKKDGSKTQYPLNPSKLMITELMLDDRRRRKILDRNAKGEKK